MSLSFLFGKTIKPEEVVRKWQRELRSEERSIDRTIRELDREEQKVKLEIKQAAKRNDTKSARILAKQIVQSRKAKERLYTSKAELHSISLALTNQLATLKVSGCLSKSAAVMKSVNQLINVPAMQKTMMAMSREMEKMGLIEEIVGDVLEIDDEEDEAQEEIDKVMDEILLGARPVPVTPLDVQKEVDRTTEEDNELQARLQALSDVKKAHQKKLHFTPHPNLNRTPMPADAVLKCRRELRTHERNANRLIRQTEREEKKLIMEIKREVSRGQFLLLRDKAKQLVQLGRAKQQYQAYITKLRTLSLMVHQPDVLLWLVTTPIISPERFLMETESDYEDEEEEMPTRWMPEEPIDIPDPSTEQDDDLMARLQALKG